jgi:hypothetical protein
VPALLWLSHSRTTAGVVRISVCTLMRILGPNPKADDCPGNGLDLYCLIQLHAINQVIACSLICYRILAYGEGKRLDCCDIISVADALGMTIIMLVRLYFVLSCRLTPSDVAPVQHGRRATVRPAPRTWCVACPWPLSW